MVAYLAKYGRAVLDHGFDICFIRPGTKRPFGKDWEAKKHGEATVERAVANGKRDFGVGIKTARTPMVDIDCYDEKLVRRMEKFVTERLGEGMKRVGLDPKLGLVYRSKKPFTKVQSKTYIDDEGRPVKLEILGDGQQFVAFAVHPDTGKPYKWLTDETPNNTHRDQLPPITREDAMDFVSEFERLCEKKGWPQKVARRSSLERGGKLDLDDPFINVKQKVDLGTDDLRAKLQSVPGCEDYDIWRDVGMALYHQYDGAEEGLILWHEWSAQASNYDSDALDEKWPTFNIEGKKREPMTARYIIKLAKEEEERIASDELDEVKTEIEEVSDLPAIRKLCDRIKHIAFEDIIRESLIPVLRDRIKTVANTNISIPTIRRMIRFENPENRVLPKWLEGMVYCTMDEVFYSQRTRVMLTHKSFEAKFARYAMTKKDRLEGRSVPEHSAVSIALNRHEIPTVHTRMYLPGAGDIFDVNGIDYANSYTDIGLPDVPEQLNRKQRRAVATVEAHLEHLFASERDRKLLLSWMAFIVQNPGRRVNWSPIIQGTQGDGKSFFHLLMGCVLGGENVSIVPGDALAEKNTAFAEGVQFCLIEEVRLHGQDRFAIINKMKPYIANFMVPIRRMRTDWYNVMNTVSYILTTNHKDGVPASSEDTRYFPMFSRWQTKAKMKRFKRDNPAYYTDLHNALKHPGALRKWLLEYPLHPEFDPDERATESSNKQEMDYLNMSDEEESFSEALAVSEDPDLSLTLLDSAKVADAMVEVGGMAPIGRALKRLLSEAGFTFIGIAKIDGKTRRYWSQEPERFVRDAKLQPARIRKWITDNQAVDI